MIFGLTCEKNPRFLFIGPHHSINQSGQRSLLHVLVAIVNWLHIADKFDLFKFHSKFHVCQCLRVYKEN